LTQKVTKKAKAKQCFRPPCFTYSILARSWTSLFWQMLIGAAFPATTGSPFCLAKPHTGNFCQFQGKQGVWRVIEEHCIAIVLRRRSLQTVEIRKLNGAVTFLWLPFFGWEPKKGKTTKHSISHRSIPKNF